MNSSHTSSRQFLGIFVFSFFLLSFSVYAAIVYLPWSTNTGASIREIQGNGFAVNKGTSKEITVWSECKKVTAGSVNVFVPTLTNSEWNQFKAHAGSVGASIVACSCSGSTPCGSPGSCYAKSGCDNQCGSSKVNDCAGTCGGSATDYNGGAAGCGSPRNICFPYCEDPVSGLCHPKYCDNTCDSGKVNDSCGVCGGDGSSCACVPNGSCSASAPACGATTYGTDNCGGSCSRTGPACAINGSCGGSANNCNAGSPSGYSAGSCGGSKTWNCLGSGGGSNASCSIANAACAVNYCQYKTLGTGDVVYISGPSTTIGSKSCSSCFWTTVTNATNLGYPACTTPTCTWQQISTNCETSWSGIPGPPSASSCNQLKAGDIVIGRWGSTAGCPYTSQELECVCQ